MSAASSSSVRGIGVEGSATGGAAAAWLIVALAVVQVLVQGSFVARGEDYVATSLAYDDLFYYLAIAWNAHALGLFTFDGVHATNGVQFLWFWILWAVAAVVPTKGALLMATLWISVAVNAATYYPLWRIGRALGRPGLALAMAVPLFYVHVGDMIFLQGMENSLHLPVLALLVAALVEAVRRADRREMTGGELIRLAALMGLAVWVRNDSAVFVAPLYLYALWLWFGRSGRRGWGPVAASALVAGAMGALMLAGNYVMGGTVVPISALVKQYMFNEGFASNLPEVTAQVLKQTNPAFHELVEVARNLKDRRPVGAGELALLLALVAAIAFPWLLLELRRRAGVPADAPRGWFAGMGPLAEVMAVLAVVLLPHFLYIASYPYFMSWYHSPFVLLAVLAVGLAFHRVAWVVASRPAGVRPALACMVAAAVVLSGWSLTRHSIFTHGTDRDFGWQIALQSERLAIARWADRTLPQDVVLASWNAGILGYYANRTLINLDGLVNDLAFYREVLPRRIEAMPEYLQRQGVSLILDRTTYDYALPDFARLEIPGAYRSMMILENRRRPIAPGAVGALDAPGRSRS